MIENMSVTVSNNNNNNNTHNHNNTNNNNNNNNINNNSTINSLNATQGQCEFNFLKRELDQKTNSTQQQQQCEITNIPLDNYQNDIPPPWKKRHIEQQNPHHPQQQQHLTTTTTNCFDLNNFTTHTLHDFDCDNDNNNDIHNDNNNLITATTTTSTAPSNNNTSSDLTFNLIGNSSFINDLFGYDANLLVPVTANLVTATTTTTNGHTTTDATFTSNTSATTIPYDSDNAAAADDDVKNWQSNDLLDLDHRYNAGLQAELTELTSPMPTKSMKVEAAPHATLSNEFLLPQHQPQEPLYSNNATPTLKQRLQQPLELQQHATAAGTDVETDLEDKNLSWLLNFKFDEFPHLSPDLGAATSTHHTTHSAISPTSSSPKTSHKSNQPTTVTVAGNCERSTSPKSSTNAGKRFKELVMEVTAELDGNDMIVAENVVVEETTIKAPKKPPFTYTELIEYALEDKGELTVSGIYQWISDRFPYYKSNDDRWKNSVRHNLSINPHFRKGHKAPQGAGHLWTISSGDSAENVLAWEHKKQRLDLFFKMESMNRERLQKHLQNIQQRHLEEQNSHCRSPHESCPQEQCLYDETAAAAAAITQEMLQSNTKTDISCNSHTDSNLNNSCSIAQRLPPTHSIELPFNDMMNDEELRKTAGQILNGIHRDVEVQAVNSIISTYQDVLLDNEDYLNPIHKDVAVSESGLRHCSHASNTHLHSQYYVTDIDPMELGIQMSHQVETAEEEVLFNDDFNLNYFSYNPGSDIAA